MSDLIPHDICLALYQKYWGNRFCDFRHRVSLLRDPSILAISLRRFRMPVPAIIALFGVLIAGCGGTHVMEIVTMYLGGRWYWGQVAVLVITVIASLTTWAVLVDVLLRPHKSVPQNGF